MHAAGTLAGEFASRRQAVWQHHMVKRRNVAAVRAIHQVAAYFQAARLQVQKAALLLEHWAQQRLLQQALDWAIDMQSSQLRISKEPQAQLLTPASGTLLVNIVSSALSMEA